MEAGILKHIKCVTCTNKYNAMNTFTQNKTKIYQANKKRCWKLKQRFLFLLIDNLSTFFLFPLFNLHPQTGGHESQRLKSPILESSASHTILLHRLTTQ